MPNLMVQPIQESPRRRSLFQSPILHCVPMHVLSLLILNVFTYHTRPTSHSL